MDGRGVLARLTRMHLVRRAKCALLTLVTLASAWLPGQALSDEPSGAAADGARAGDVSVERLHLEITAEEFAAMQPAAPAFAGPAGPPAAPPPPPTNGREVERNFFGTAFPWVKGTLVDPSGRRNVDVRYAGDFTYFLSSTNIKRPLALRFDDKLVRHLHAMPLDPSHAREVLGFRMFRALGVPAPRPVFAEVVLTVPGRYDQEYLGLYTLVEPMDPKLLEQHTGRGDGLLLKPFGMRGIDYLGDQWAPYAGSFRPQREANLAEQRRLVEFARLINQADDAEFEQQIHEILDVEEFLRFMAANALSVNLESFLALGHNYYLYLDPGSNRFLFLPGDLEFSFANFLLMGSPEQLMDLSLTKPYPGENKLVDRLLAIPAVQSRYKALLAELAADVFTDERLTRELAAIESATRAVREKETAAVASRAPAAPAFGGPGPGPTPPDLDTFIEQRTASIAAQLAGSRPGYVPQLPMFGPPRQENTGPIDETTFRASVEVPPEFEATLFATSPTVNYPVAIAAAPTGEIYVAVDEQGSLGRTPGGGKVLRCVDRDDDGKVDDVTVFAKVEHPRGVCYRDGNVWVMHPPTLSVFRDDDRDGVADRQEELVTGLTTELVDTRGGDHTTNCVRMGIDGWLYIGVGDYGIHEARGKDGTTISLRGGGIVRVRPDGTELEIFCSGLRNPFDIAIDPQLNLFTRDNTNDGGGWDTRIMHLVQSAEYGYTRLFANFTEETMPPLGTFGGGGGTGGLYVQHPAWPEPYRDVLLTGDWGRSEVYWHALAPAGPTFRLQQDVLLKIPRATGMDMDSSGRLYVASWWGGESSVYVGPHVGFIARVTPKGFVPAAAIELADADLDQLVHQLAAPQGITRLDAQGKMLRRGCDAESAQTLEQLAASPTTVLEGRIAAVFTLKQLGGRRSHAALLRLAEEATIREFALRALTDRSSELEGLPIEPFTVALADASPRVRAQALISLGRLKNTEAAAAILPLTLRPEGSSMPSEPPVQNQPDPDRVLPHLAVRALVALAARDACLEALDGPYAGGALQALRVMHDVEVVERLIKKLATVRDEALRQEILVTLIRLYHREADYDGSWWGIRPDTSGPYFDPVTWDGSARIAEVVTAAVLDAEPQVAAQLKAQLARHSVALPDLPASDDAASAEEETALVVPQADPDNPDQIGNLTYEAAAARTLAASGAAARGAELFKSQSCVACHTTADGQRPKGPHLVDIGKRYKPEELVESILRPSAKLAQGYETYVFETAEGLVYTGFVVGERARATLIREASGLLRELPREAIESRSMRRVSVMPEGLASNLTPAQLADLLAYLQTLK